MGFLKDIFKKKGAILDKTETEKREVQDESTIISNCMTLLQKYKDGKTVLENRIISNERWYRLRHWEIIGNKTNEPEPTSAWLFNVICNKHADAMDNIPEPIVLPRELSDEESANILTSVLPVVLEQNDFEQTYSDMWWYKLKNGTGVYGVFWNQSKNNGLGDVDIRTVDLLNLFWEPGIKDIQKSPNLFHVELEDKKIIEARYPEIEGKTSSNIDIGKYIHDENIDTSDKVAVIDWYYKVNFGGRDIVHYCKIIGETVIYCSEQDSEYSERGFYDHGLYPFVFDTLFPMEDSPCGFGYIDVGKSPQAYIDKLDSCIQKTSVMASNPRFFIRGDGTVNEKEFADFTKAFVHYSGSGNPSEQIFPISVNDISSVVVNVRELKVNEMKETCGNRDFQQGGTAGGVTAASAISALQEAGNKLSRDIIKSSDRAFKRVVLLCIEYMRQFYDMTRYFRITENNQTEFVSFDNSAIAPQQQTNDFGVDMGTRLPLFDLDIKTQKSATYAVVAENERAKELYRLGFFNPANAEQALAALEIMHFENIDKIRETITANSQKYMMTQQLMAQNQQLMAQNQQLMM